MQSTGSRRGVPRRNNAPVRPTKPASGIPDLLFAMAATAWAMAAVFALASVADHDIADEAAGRALARMFSGALAVCGLFTFLLGLVLLRDDGGDAGHYVTPMLIGLVIGAAESGLFLMHAGTLLLAPFILIVFVLRPVRRMVARTVAPSRGYKG